VPGLLPITSIVFLIASLQAFCSILPPAGSLLGTLSYDYFFPSFPSSVFFERWTLILYLCRTTAFCFHSPTPLYLSLSSPSLLGDRTLHFFALSFFSKVALAVVYYPSIPAAFPTVCGKVWTNSKDFPNFPGARSGPSPADAPDLIL